MTDYVVPESRISIPEQSPEAFKALQAFNVATSKGLDFGLRHLVLIRASQINGCSYCVDMHSTDTREHGETERRLNALAAWEESRFFTARERAALALTEAITRVSETHVPDEVWAAAEKEFQPAELSQLVLTIGSINAFNRIAVSSRSTPRP